MSPDEKNEIQIAKNGWFTIEGLVFLVGDAIDIMWNRKTLNRTVYYDSQKSVIPTPYQSFVMKLKAIVGDNAEIHIEENGYDHGWTVFLRWETDEITFNYKRHFPRSIFKDKNIVEILSMNFLDFLIKEKDLVKKNYAKPSVQPTNKDRFMIQMQELLGEKVEFLERNNLYGDGLDFTIKYELNGNPEELQIHCDRNTLLKIGMNLLSDDEETAEQMIYSYILDSVRRMKGNVDNPDTTE